MTEKKKKKGFFSILVKTFLFLLLASPAITVAIVHYKPKEVTRWVLQEYTQLLSKTLTSPKYYQIATDQDYNREFKGKEGSSGFDKEALKEKYFSKRREEISKAFTSLIQKYEAAKDTQHWYSIFTALKQKINSIFQDGIILADEHRELLQQINDITKEK